MDAEAALSVHNLAFLEALYEAWERDPASVDPQWIPLLQGRDDQGQGGLPTVEPGSTVCQVRAHCAAPPTSTPSGSANADHSPTRFTEP